jgi:peptidoglycan lytic transglycosylase
MSGMRCKIGDSRDGRARSLLRVLKIAFGAMLLMGLAACGGAHRIDRDIYGPGPGGSYRVGSPYSINGVWYYPAENPSYNAVGTASWYGRESGGNSTANGERFDPHRLTAAHTTLPLPVLVRVTNLENNRSIVLRVNDRGPFVAGRIIDVSEAAAEELGFRAQGTARVRVEYVGRADGGAPQVASVPTGAIPSEGESSALSDMSSVEDAISAIPPKTAEAPGT